MNIHKFLGVIIKPFRQKRMHAFMQSMKPNIDTPILDVGGGEFNWELIDYKGSVVLLNVAESGSWRLKKNKSDRFDYVVGDGTALNYDENDFELVYSNSVIEHLSNFENQQKFAHEMRRVGKSIWCQTPAREFIIEPHYITPFIHWLSKQLQRKLLRNFSVWGLMTRPSQDYVNGMVDELRLLTFKEMELLFPDCKIIREKFLFMTKSYIAVRNVNSSR